MPTQWTHIRVPAALASRLAPLAQQAEANHAAGRSPLPPEHCERCPVWLIIARALDEQEARRERSRRPRRRAPRP
jgi:hypothetical protein